LRQLGYKDTIKGIRLSDNTSLEQKLPNTTLIKYDASSTKSICDQVASVILKHNGGKEIVFCAELAQNFNWNSR